MTNLVSGAQAIEFLRQHLSSGEESLGKAFLKQFNIPLQGRNGFEVFGYCPATDLYHADDDAYAIKLIFTSFVQETAVE